MDKEKDARPVQGQGDHDLQEGWLDPSIWELITNHSLEEGEMEAIEQLLALGEVKDVLHLEDIFRWIPGVEQDQKLLEDILDLLHAAQIQVVGDENSSQQEDDIDVHVQDDLQIHAVDAGDTIGLYLTQVGKVPLLEREEEIELAKRIERGREASAELVKGSLSKKKKAILKSLIEDGLAAREHLLLANVRLVFSVAKKYSGRGIPILDLVQEGHIGLMRATKKYDYRRGHKFSTYATWWIRQAVSRYVADKGRTIRLPVHMGDRINKMLRARHRIIQNLGHEPTPEEVAKELDETPEDVAEMLKYAQRAISLDSPVNDEDDSTLADYIEDIEALDPVELTTQQLLSEHVNRMLAEIPPREARILRLRFGLSGGHAHTLNEIGEKLGITRERVRQIETQARNRIRRYGLQDQLREYLQD
jgi:RNA polymerase primary sigma factor